MKISLIICCLALVLGTNCSYRDLKNADPSAQTFAQSGANMGFSQIQAAVLGPKCARCHGGMVASYEAVKNLSLEIQGRISSTDANFLMPPPNAAPLTTEEKNLLLTWIAAGSPREPNSQPNPPTPTPTPPPGTPPIVPPNPAPGPTPRLSFANVSAVVFQPKCARCHSGMVGSYERVVANLHQIEMRVRSNFDFEKMPPPRAPQLTPEELNLLLDWIQAGAPKEGSDNPSSPNPPSQPSQPSPPKPTPPPAPTPPCDEQQTKKGDDDHCENDFINQSERPL